MSKIGDYLNQRLVGEVLSNDNILEKYSVDGSILQITPKLVVFPRTINDVRKTVRFSWRMAERGQAVTVVARGSGSDPTGGSLTDGIVISMQSHMNHIMEIDTKSRLVRVQSGIKLMALREALATYGLKLPFDDGSTSERTIGGLIGSNAVTDVSPSAGSVLDAIDSLEVVLSNGEVIQTGKLNKRELSSKKGLESMEGDLYRFVDSLIEDNPDAIDMVSAGRALNCTTYALDLVKDRSGNFDLTPLFVGSQCRLGIVTQVIFRLTDTVDDAAMLGVALTDDQDEADLINRLMKLEPSEFTFIDGRTLRLMQDVTGYQPWHVITQDMPKALLFVTFDGKHRNKHLRQAGKILDSVDITDAKVALSPEDCLMIRTLRDATYIVNNYDSRYGTAIHLMDNIAVAPEDTFTLVERLRNLLDKRHIKAGVWGNIGSGLVTVRPIVNLASLGHRQAIFGLLSEITKLTRELGGNIAGSGGTGMLLAPYARAAEQSEVTMLSDSLKHDFDPLNIFNGKPDAHDQDFLVRSLRKSYTVPHIDEYNIRA